MSIRCQGILKSFGGVRALDGVTVQFPDCSIVGVIGPNGAGKTTLINVITGLLRPDGGRVFSGSRDITGEQPHRMAALGVVRTFQGVRLIRQLTTLENVLLGRPRQRGEKLSFALSRLGVANEERANRRGSAEILEFVGLGQCAGKLAGSLSYGQQKLLSLAICLATDATVMLLDEPVAGVHPDLGAKILNLLRELRRDGKLIVFVEHDIAAIREIAESVIVMDDGKIIAQGAPADVLSRSEILESYID